MNVIHEQVRHHQFGDGTVIDQAATMIEVKFGNEYGTKKFIYPTAFETFLELSNNGSKEKMIAELLEIREQIEAQRRQSIEASQKLQMEEHQKLLDQKRATAKKRASATKKAPAKSKKKKETIDDFAANKDNEYELHDSNIEGEAALD